MSITSSVVEAAVAAAVAAAAAARPFTYFPTYLSTHMRHMGIMLQNLSIMFLSSTLKITYYTFATTVPKYYIFYVTAVL